MTLLAVPFAVTIGRSGAMAGIGVGIGIAIVYWTTISVFAALGTGGVMAPAARRVGAEPALRRRRAVSAADRANLTSSARQRPNFTSSSQNCPFTPGRVLTVSTTNRTSRTSASTGRPVRRRLERPQSSKATVIGRAASRRRRPTGASSPCAPPRARGAAPRCASDDSTAP